MAESILKCAIYALKALLEFEHTFRKGRVFEEDEKELLVHALDLLNRLLTRTVGPFGEDL